MSDDSASSRGVAQAIGELAMLEVQVASARAVLIRLLQEVVQAEVRLDNSQTSLLVEANEALVMAAMRQQAEVDEAAQALGAMSDKIGLDPLTQLPNRGLFADRFTRAIASAKRRNEPLAVLFLDLNAFKLINDTLGHGAGDEVLTFAAHCLGSVVRDVDTVSRYGGDEFLILLTEVSQAADAMLVARKIVTALAVPCRVGGHVVRLTASIGVALYPEDGTDAETLIARADKAMYAAKARGPGSCVVHAGQIAVTEDFGATLKSLRQPLTQYELARAELDVRYAQLQEANEQLVVAALEAQELQSAAEQAQQRQMEFLAVIAHELRNPLAPIRLATSMLGRVRTDEPLLSRAQAIIERQTVQISRLIGDLLDGTRDSTHRLEIRPEWIDVVDILDHAIDASRPAMDARLQSFEVNVPSRALRIHGDSIRLVQVFSNLLNNASKYTPDGGAIVVTVEVTANADAVVLRIRDNGIGITAEVLPNVFKPFVQDAHAIGFNGVGLGVGLTVVRQLVEAHGGTVLARSAGRGQGSEFVVTLRLAAHRSGGEGSE